jgi:uncharacterized protein involved in high-affinity Fe2+ transport
MRTYPRILFVTALLLFFVLSSPTAESQMSGTSVIQTTHPARPLTVKSNEATMKQLAYAKAEGDSVTNAINWILKQASNSGRLNAGEYTISYALGAPEGWYTFNNQMVNWQQPNESNAHLWVFVQDGADGRVVPPLDIKLTIRNTYGSLVESKKLPYAWMPLINGYGENILLPENANYQFVLEIEPPEYHRHDPYNGDRFMQKTTAVFEVQYSGNSATKKLSDVMENQQRLAQKAGQAYSNTLQAMYKQANDGKDTTKGDYFFACAVEYSEGYWYQKNNKMVYKMDNELSAANNAHVEVVVRDKNTGRFMHDLPVTVTLYDASGKKLGTKMEMFMWHPWLYHYGENWRVPRPGSYKVHVHIDPPPYRRYGKISGKQFTSPEDLDFQNIMIKTGQK